MGALRELSVTAQVALLFVVLFGLLLCVTAYAVVVSLKDLPAEQAQRQHRFRRELGAVWFGTTVFWLSWISGPIGATLLFGVLSFLALREFITLTHTRRGDHRSLILAFFIVLPLQYVIVGMRAFDLFTVFIPVYVFFALPVIGALGNDPKHFLERTAKIQWGVMVCVYGLSHAPALLLLDFRNYQGRGAFLVLFLVIVVAVGEMAQKGAGVWLRRRPVARHISRDFSWNSWLVGVACAAFIGALLYWVTPFKPIQALLMALVASASGSFGQFVINAFKRDAGVHQWGERGSVTGAVGLLDRMAAMCFAAPVFFHAARWYFAV
ncbi:MAG: phosphatidate cytidylyltransferase [Rhizobacter sp.]|nr:phosphatidate cytidylyltransferase [Rhizobacter sp.]